MDLFSEACDTLNFVNEQDLTVDQLLQLAQVRALLSIAQELSKIHYGGVNPEYDSH